MKTFVGIDGKKYPLVRRQIHAMMSDELKEIVMMRKPTFRAAYEQKSYSISGSRLRYFRSRSSSAINRETNDLKTKVIWHLLFDEVPEYHIMLRSDKLYGVYNDYETYQYNSLFRTTAQEMAKYGIDVSEHTKAIIDAKKSKP